MTDNADHDGLRSEDVVPAGQLSGDLALEAGEIYQFQGQINVAELLTQGISATTHGCGRVAGMPTP
jgi:hypothetical protein